MSSPQSDAKFGRMRELSIVWLVAPVAVGAGLTALAALGHYRWQWSDFATGTMVNFGSSVALVSLFFLLERRFERRAERQWSLWSALATRSRRSDERTQALLGPLFLTLARTGRVPIESISCSAYRVDPRLLANAQLERIASLTLGLLDVPAITWTKGKGVLGRCWETGQPQCVDLWAWSQRVDRVDRDQFTRLSGDLRMGLAYEEMKQVAGRYAAVLAVPVEDPSCRIVGCLAIEISSEAGKEAIDFLESRPVLDASMSAARVLAAVWS